MKPDDETGRWVMELTDNTNRLAEDQRSSSRREYPYKQLVASVADSKMPSLTDFRMVPCEDLSCGGFAFYLEDEPEFDECVVGLGMASNLTYLCARVVHTQRVLRRGQIRYRVGCQFTGRARFDRSTLSVVRMPDDSVAKEPDTREEQRKAEPPASPDEGEPQKARNHPKESIS